jgi:hypothetical protein
MKTARRLSPVVALFGCVLALGACGKSSDTRTDAKAGPEAVGRTGQLRKNATPPAYNLEQVGTDKRAWEKPGFTVRAGEPVQISGWAVDGPAKAAAQGVEVMLGGVPFEARYGIDRPDVGVHFGSASCSKAGYSLEIAGSKLPKGRSAMTIRVISADGSSYQESPAYSLTVE